MVTQKNVDAIFKAIADPTRRAILEALRREPLAVQALAERFSTMSRPAISKHLRILRQAGLVEEDQQGRKRFYHLQAGALADLRNWLEPFRSVGGEGVSHGTAGRGRVPSTPAQSAKEAALKSSAWQVW